MNRIYRILEKIETLKYNYTFCHYLQIVTFFIFMLLLVVSCSTVRYIPIENSSNTKIEFRDSVRIKDSVVVIPVYTVKEISNIKDTLVMENENSISKTYVDSSLMILKGSLKSKGNIKYKTLVKERVIEKTDTAQIIKEIPVEVTKEVKTYPTSYWFFLISFIVTLAIIFLKIFWRFKKFI